MPTTKRKRATQVPETCAAPIAPAPQGEQSPSSQKWTRESKNAPPGLLGEIAAYHQHACARPREASALAAGLATVAAIAARAYRVAGAPLHVYLAVPEDQGEAAETVARLISALAPICPEAELAIGPANVGSTVAVVRHLDRTPSFCSHWRDGLATLRASAQDDRREDLRGLLAEVWRTPLLAASPMPSAPLTRPIRNPAPTLIVSGSEADLIAAQQAPDRLAERFLSLRSPAAELNQQPSTTVPPELLGQLVELHRVAQQLTQAGTHIDIPIASQAKAAFAELAASPFAVEKAHRVAGLAAVSRNPYAPQITPELAAWAIQLIQTDAQIIAAAQAQPDPADTLAAQRQKQRDRVLDRLRHYQSQPWSFVQRNALSPEMHRARICPLQWLSAQLAAQTTFSSDPAGGHQALKRALLELIESGEVEEVPVSQLKAKYGRTARCFALCQ